MALDILSIRRCANGHLVGARFTEAVFCADNAAIQRRIAELFPVTTTAPTKEDTYDRDHAKAITAVTLLLENYEHPQTARSPAARLQLLHKLQWFLIHEQWIGDAPEASDQLLAKIDEEIRRQGGLFYKGERVADTPENRAAAAEGLRMAFAADDAIQDRSAPSGSAPTVENTPLAPLQANPALDEKFHGLVQFHPTETVPDTPENRANARETRRWVAETSAEGVTLSLAERMQDAAMDTSMVTAGPSAAETVARAQEPPEADHPPRDSTGPQSGHHSSEFTHGSVVLDRNAHDQAKP